MHGSITVESRQGGGSIFTVVLPVEDIELHPAGISQTMRRTMVSAEPIPTTKLASTVSAPPQSLTTSNDNTTKKIDKAEDKTQHLDILVVDDSPCFLACPLYPC
jgi:hypothetical protein